MTAGSPVPCLILIGNFQVDSWSDLTRKESHPFGADWATISSEIPYAESDFTPTSYVTFNFPQFFSKEQYSFDSTKNVTWRIWIAAYLFF